MVDLLNRISVCTLKTVQQRAGLNELQSVFQTLRTYWIDDHTEIFHSHTLSNFFSLFFLLTQTHNALENLFSPNYTPLSHRKQRCSFQRKKEKTSLLCLTVIAFRHIFKVKYEPFIIFTGRRNALGGF